MLATINYIVSNSQNKGSWESNAKTNDNIIISRSEVIIDQFLDPNTSYQYEISTYNPENISGKKLPLIVILDADFNYSSLLNVSQQLMNEDSIPESIVVGVGYGRLSLEEVITEIGTFYPMKLVRWNQETEVTLHFF